MNDAFNIEHFIQKEITKLIPMNHEVHESYHWSLFPAGKLFRPNLALSICKDLNPNLYLESINLKNKDLLYFASSLECHHAYSLVHDDLPSMDNDDFRRGKESTHKKYGEWKAILVGDGLLNISYEFLSKIEMSDAKRFLELFKLYSKCLGPKGLIQGQTLDLSNEMGLSFQNTILTHKLKTGRLIQVAILGATFLSIPKNRKLEKSLWRCGENIGILFQLLDDLSELSETNLSKHELEVNPWLKFQLECNLETLNRLKTLLAIQKELNLASMNHLLANYFKKMNELFKGNLTQIKINLNSEIELKPIMLLLDQLCSLN